MFRNIAYLYAITPIWFHKDTTGWGLYEFKQRGMLEGNENSTLSLWKTTFDDSETGGYVKVHKGRITQSQKSKNELIKYQKEHSMAVVFAHNGYKIKMLAEVLGIPSTDVTINGIPADFKCTKSTGNIVKYAKKALIKQGAKIVLFQFDNMTPAIMAELDKLSKIGIHGKYFITGKTKVLDF